MYKRRVYTIVLLFSIAATYMGCFKDSKDRLMKIRTPDGRNDMSADLCREFCTDYRYFGMQVLCITLLYTFVFVFDFKILMLLFPRI